MAASRRRVRNLAFIEQVVGVACAGLTIYVMLFFAALYGWIFMGEMPYNYHLIGVLLVLLGVRLASRTP